MKNLVRRTRQGQFWRTGSQHSLQHVTSHVWSRQSRLEFWPQSLHPTGPCSPRPWFLRGAQQMNGPSPTVCTDTACPLGGELAFPAWLQVLSTPAYSNVSPLLPKVPRQSRLPLWSRWSRRFLDSRGTHSDLMKLTALKKDSKALPTPLRARARACSILALAAQPV